MPIAGDAEPVDPLVGRTIAGGRYTVAGVLGRTAQATGVQGDTR